MCIGDTNPRYAAVTLITIHLNRPKNFLQTNIIYYYESITQHIYTYWLLVWLFKQRFIDI